MGVQLCGTVSWKEAWYGRYAHARLLRLRGHELPAEKRKVLFPSHPIILLCVKCGGGGSVCQSEEFIIPMGGGKQMQYVVLAASL